MGFRHYPAIVAALRNPLMPGVWHEASAPPPPLHSIYIFKSVPSRISATHGCEAACMRPASGLDIGEASGIAMSMQTDASAHDAMGSSEQMQRVFARGERVAHTDFLFPESREQLIDLLRAHRADFAPSDIPRLLTAVHDFRHFEVLSQGIPDSARRVPYYGHGLLLVQQIDGPDTAQIRGQGRLSRLRFFTRDIAMDNKTGVLLGFLIGMAVVNERLVPANGGGAGQTVAAVIAMRA